jgi:hypothetical protein
MLIKAAKQETKSLKSILTQFEEWKLPSKVFFSENIPRGENE